MQRHRASEAVLTFLTALDCPGDGLGRVLRDGQGKPTAIIEHTDATPEIKALREINAGAYCFQAQWLWPRLAQLQPSNSGEYYLVDLVSLAARAGDLVETETCEDPREALGVNTRVQLAQAEAILRQRIRERWMLQGVTILDPASTFIDMEVEIGQDTVLHPNTMLYGKSRIGSRCVLGPNTIIRESVVGPGCTVLASVVERSVLEEGVDIGPFSHLREESYIENGVHLGNFVEVKKSRLGKGAKSGHFSYLGDATIGANVNIGAGTVTCNYDGVNKNPTFIEEDAFIGCDTMLVAPVKVGKGAITGAGSVVTKDVPPGEVVVGVPAKPMPRSKGRPGKGKSASSRS
jgi:bifunctional UDP-N-acetylglucosamine pyrophosphorylase/glucosamine-1-phosphate N-acetyltransferase